ncbi:GNAT family N-acetyltransferase [Streptomyces sp. DSM 44938]|uniref:GNAT family N-acetyltransferase n=1 Tax=Streptomyces litchfieldiae TaxID=3075543 RepID=A0ABU2MII9_9ACTN|nr:GNAT family N-acetyltransferase [Streptomyces sp. DSM 44938]MDT0341280.1 GNAT family N-acetyltransferase [Streptomyces sp. DSM 44938]
MPGAGLPGSARGIREVYVETFCAPPWDEEPACADAYLERLARDAARPGFTAALARDGDGTVLGFATAWTTERPFPTGRCYPRVAAAVGPDRVEEWLCGGREIDELAVRPRAQGLRLGAALLAAVAEGAPGGRCWLLTSARNPGAVAFYRRRGWRPANAPDPVDTGFVVFLGPDHPALGT